MLNEYFGYESKDLTEFKYDFMEDIVPEAQATNLISFLMHLQRKIDREML